jgi:hypothetical protein
VSLFPSRGSASKGLKARLVELERAHESLKAETKESLTLLTFLTAPAWLRDYTERARATGWIVTCSPRAIVFHRPEAVEHSYTLELPLPDDRHALELKRRALHSRIIIFERFVA